MHKFSINNTPDRPYLTWLKEGIKTAEGRVNTLKFRNIKVGDEIMFADKNDDKFIRGFVTFKHEYNSFAEMLTSEGIKNMLPFLTDDKLKEAVQVYENFPGSERVKEFGCVAIGIQVQDCN